MIQEPEKTQAEQDKILVDGLIADYADLDNYAPIDPTKRLREDLKLDDLDLLCILTDLEIDSGLDLDDKAFNACQTAKDLTDLVAKTRAAT